MTVLFNLLSKRRQKDRSVIFSRHTGSVCRKQIPVSCSDVFFTAFIFEHLCAG